MIDTVYEIKSAPYREQTSVLLFHRLFATNTVAIYKLLIDLILIIPVLIPETCTSKLWLSLSLSLSLCHFLEE